MSKQPERIVFKSNCLIQAIKHKIKNPKGKIGYSYRDTKGDIFFFYITPEGKTIRFGRALKRHSNKAKYWFIGYVYCEEEQKRRDVKYKRHILF